MAGTNWRRVADVLADRLANHAYCETHPAGKADVDCPSCRDRAAYGRYETAARAHIADMTPGGTGYRDKARRLLAERDSGEYRNLPKWMDEAAGLLELIAGEQ